MVAEKYREFRQRVAKKIGIGHEIFSLFSPQEFKKYILNDLRANKIRKEAYAVRSFSIYNINVKIC